MASNFGSVSDHASRTGLGRLLLDSLRQNFLYAARLYGHPLLELAQGRKNFLRESLQENLRDSLRLYCWPLLEGLPGVASRPDIGNINKPAEAGKVLPNIAFNPVFLQTVDVLELSARAADGLKNDNIVYIGDLVQRTEADLLRTPYYGRRTLNEIKEVLAQMGLYLGMEVPGWPPANLAQFQQQHGELAEQGSMSDLTFNPALLQKIEELELTVSATNLLKSNHIVYIGDLVQRSEADLLRMPSFGRRSLNEIKEVLGQIGMHLGMELLDWPPEDISQPASSDQDVDETELAKKT